MEEPVEHTEKRHGTGAAGERESSHSLQTRYEVLMEHHRSLLLHQRMLVEYHFIVQDRYHLLLNHLWTHDQGPALRRYRRGLRDHYHLLHIHRTLLQEHFQLVQDLHPEEHTYQHSSLHVPVVP